MTTVTYDDLPPEDPYANVTPLHPHANTAAEAALLSLIVEDPERINHLHHLIDADDFYEPRHETLWNTFTHIRDQGLVPDHATLLEQLRTQGDTTRVRLHELTPTTTGAIPTQAASYAHAIRTAAIARRAAATITRAQQHIQTATGPEQLEDALAGILDTAEHGLRVLWGNGPTTAPLHTDLTWLTTGQTPTVDPPTWVHTANGHALFYAARVNGIFGDPEAAKTWLAMVGAVEVLTAGGTVAFIDVDHNGPQIITERLILLGANPHDLANPARFQLHEPDDGPALRDTIRALVKYEPTYVVLDSIGEMMPMLGIKSVDNDELSGALRATATTLANTGACVVTIDHLPKSTESRSSGFAIGGTAKKRAIDGSYIHADARTPPAPGHLGKITLRIEKDRPGRLREHARGKYLGTFTIDSTNTGVTTISIDNESPITDDGKLRPTGYMEKISRFVEDHDQATYRNIKDHTGGGDPILKAAIGCLVDEGFLSVFSGPNNSKRHHSIAIFREADDTHA